MRALKTAVAGAGALALTAVLTGLPTVADALHRLPHPKRI